MKKLRLNQEFIHFLYKIIVYALLIADLYQYFLPVQFFLLSWTT